MCTRRGPPQPCRPHEGDGLQPRQWLASCRRVSRSAGGGEAPHDQDRHHGYFRAAAGDGAKGGLIGTVERHCPKVRTSPNFRGRSVFTIIDKRSASLSTVDSAETVR